MNQNKQGYKTPRSIKYSNAALAGQQVTINGQNFGLFVVDGQKVYLGIEEPTEPLDGIYYPINRWAWHLARNIENGVKWFAFRAVIGKELETAVLYGCGIKKVGGKEVAVISCVDIQGGVSVLNKSKCNKKISAVLSEIHAFLGEKYPNLQKIAVF